MSGVSPLLRAKRRDQQIMDAFCALPGFRMPAAELEESLADFERIWAASDGMQRALYGKCIAGMLVEALDAIIRMHASTPRSTP